jgi:hypothetical protein
MNKRIWKVVLTTEPYLGSVVRVWRNDGLPPRVYVGYRHWYRMERVTQRYAYNQSRVITRTMGA